MTDIHNGSTPTGETTDKKQKWENWKQFAFLAALSVGEVWVLYDGNWPPLDNWRGWLMAFGGVVIPVATVASFFQALRNWSPEKADNVITTSLLWIVGGPIILGLALWAAISVFGWFGSIPSWAAVIIVLLFALLMKK